jgi:hypothetical protein
MGTFTGALHQRETRVLSIGLTMSGGPIICNLQATTKEKGANLIG